MVDFPEEDTLTVRSQKNGEISLQRFEFDRTFQPTATQEQIFDAVRPLVISVLDGYNVCIFAYVVTFPLRRFD